MAAHLAVCLALLMDEAQAGELVGASAGATAAEKAAEMADVSELHSAVS
jgi:hypothetical protein